MKHRWRGGTAGRCVAGAMAVVTVALLGGCASGGSELVVRPPAAHPASSSRSPTPSGTAGAVRVPRVVVTPAAGLRDSQQVQVTVSGFSPAQALVALQCADKGHGTGQGDCDVTGMAFLRTGADGTAQASLTVRRGPFGANAVVCSSTRLCLVSVSQATPSPTEQADARITFS